MSDVSQAILDILPFFTVGAIATFTIALLIILGSWLIGRLR
jgi:hypothetical protein